MLLSPRRNQSSSIATDLKCTRLVVSSGNDSARSRIWIMGGGQVYRAAMPFADDLVVTKIDHEYSNADTFAPEIGDEWILDDPGTYSVSKTNLGYRFERYLRA
ncbi:hypothetical protein BMH30_08595 [Leucobacter sp. OLES1]|nr:hypothetical protein BMH30_08595 [Leucobacter sp. OLES1]